MKKHFLYAFALLSAQTLFGQGNPQLPEQANKQWKTSGNVVDTNQFIGSKNERPVVFKSNNIERFRISPDGNVGIGTSMPQAKLDVNGSVIFRDNVILENPPTAYDLLTMKMLGLQPNGDIVTTNSIGLLELMYGPCELLDEFGNPIPQLTPHWSNGLNKIYLDCDPVNVGIGTDSPNSKLDVKGVTLTSKLAIGIADPNNLDGFFHLRDPSMNPNNNDNVFLIDNPLKQLLSLDNQGMLFTNDIDNSGIINTSRFIISNNSTDPSFIVQNNSQKLLQLDSDGLLRTRRVKVDVYNWPDYVFEENYNLMSLEDTKNYIQENRHLPGVPSAEEVEKEGLDLAEMNKILLKKIEELTLLIIKQQEEIEEVKASCK